MKARKLSRFHWAAAALAGALSVSGCVEGQSQGRSDSAPDSTAVPVEVSKEDAKDSAMTASISPDLLATFEQGEEDSAIAQRVIITLNETSGAHTLNAVQGVKVINTMQGAPIVIAEVNAQGLKALSENPAIERVEPDGEMRAQPK